MTKLELYLRKFTQTESSSTELMVAPRTVPRLTSMVDRIVFLDDHHSFDVQICKIKLGEMFKKSYFSVCAVRECAELLKASLYRTQQTYDRLHVLHCVDWNVMPGEIRNMIPDMISEVLTEGAYSGQVISDQ